MKRWFLAGVALGIVVPIVGGGLAFLFWQKTELIAFGVCIQGINVGGIKLTEARRILESKFDPPDSVTVAITYQGRVIRKVQLGELKIKPDIDETLRNALQVGRRDSLKESLREFLVAWQGGIHLPMSYDWDEQYGRQVLNQISQSLSYSPQKALVEWHKGTVRIIPSRKGLKVAIEETLKAWAEKLKRGGWEILPLIATEVQPEVKTEDVISIDGVLGQATTYFRASERNRSHNIRLAASRLDHVLIRPGETISFNQLVGPRTPRQGFRVARVLVQGQFAEDFGGGVCQVAGTLYLAALRAGMDVVQRHRHSRTIDYLPPGFDATVNFGSLDLKLRNPFDTPLYLRTFVKGGRLTVLILGKQQRGVSYKIVRAVEKFSKPVVKQVFVPDLPTNISKVVDKGSSGYRVVVWRLRVENGVVMKRELISSDIYPSRPRLIRIGRTGEKKEPSLPQPQPATSTSINGIPSSETEDLISPESKLP